MSKTFIPRGYRSSLSLYDTQLGIGFIKRIFEDNLSGALHLRRVSAPLVVDPSTGINDDLSGVERPVSFDLKDSEKMGSVVQSLAKWKRMALWRYGYQPGEGIYADMNAIRRDEELDNIHSIYVDQWDWEKVITEEQRTLEYLENTVRDIVRAIVATNYALRCKFPSIKMEIDENLSIVTSQQLEDLWPDKSSKEREYLWVKDHHTTLIEQIGGALKSGKSHDGRAPDYDDWQLNGDILIWDELLDMPIEISSMGIRVSPESLDRQLSLSGCDNRRKYEFHRLLLEGKLPLTMGGGIGQSRLCLILLEKAHIGEVQSSIWNDETVNTCTAAGIELL
ncbi:MAG: aspartate--ammonia ligase [Clostridiales bacterium]|jgi:aspartate--ammonia ligase|nr:aspartate--ammonia ligase [Clostridiales bacterium]